jgi:CDGSH-type Zn-finger protein
MKPKIKVKKDGPYVVTGNLPLCKEYMVSSTGQNYPDTWKKGDEYPRRETCALCRCGRSANPPYCDGTHAKVNFIGTETASRKNYADLAETTRGPGLDLTDAESLCAIACFCHRAPGDTWEHAEKSDDPRLKQMAIEEAGNCPSGRLVAWEKISGKPLEPAFEPAISVTEDVVQKVSGPLWVKGGVEIETSDGFNYEVRNRVTLCRCGRSANKPFCNGNHVRIKYNDGDEVLK